MIDILRRAEFWSGSLITLFPHRSAAMLRDFVQCIKFGSNGEMVRGLRLLGGLLYSRFKYDMGPLHYSLFRVRGHVVV